VSTLKNWNSRKLTQGDRQGIKAFYYGLGWDKDDFNKPLIGIGTPLHEINLCNLHSYEVGAAIKSGLEDTNLLGFRIGVPSVSDNITQGHEGGNASLPSRNVIASSAEMVATSHCFDGFIGLHHCDKNGPGFAMALARTNLPGFVISGGTIKPGSYKGKELTIQDVYDVQAASEIGKASAEELDAVVRHACPGPGGCGIAASFNTWGLAMEAMGLMPPYSSSNPSEGQEKTDECAQAGRWMSEILEKGLRPRDIITRASLGNATAMIGAAGGSTNGILHILALALEAGVDFNLKNIQQILRNTPVFCNFAPRGKGTMIDLFKMGGTPMLIKHLIEAGVLNGSTPTLFADSLSAQVANAVSLPDNQDLVAPAGSPFKDYADVQICFGNLAPDGIVFKVSSRRGAGFEGQAVCFADADSLVDAVNAGRIRPGHVVVLRGMGPVAMGMPEVLLATAALSNPELDGKVALVSDARVSGLSHGAIGIHCSPEAAAGGPIASVMDGDIISFDLLKGAVKWKSGGQESEIDSQTFPAFKGKEIYLREFSQNTTQAHQGCVAKQVIEV
jgi:dihydroxy-acid dehydratase